MSAFYYLIAMVDNCIPQRQLGSCIVTRPFLSLQRVWLVRLVQGLVVVPVPGVGMLLHLGLVHYFTWCLAAFLSLSSLIMTCFNPTSFRCFSGSAGFITRDLFFGGFTPSPPQTPHPGEKEEKEITKYILHPIGINFTRKI